MAKRRRYRPPPLSHLPENTDAECLAAMAMHLLAPDFERMVGAVGAKAALEMVIAWGGRRMTIPTVSSVIQAMRVCAPILEHRRTKEDLAVIARRRNLDPAAVAIVYESAGPWLDAMEMARKEARRTQSR